MPQDKTPPSVVYATNFWLISLCAIFIVGVLTGCGDDGTIALDVGFDVGADTDSRLDVPVLPDVPPPCMANCSPMGVPHECGDDGCGGSCGDCPDGEECEAPQAFGRMCICAPQCDGRTCGDDGCGGSCGDCPAGAVCEVGGVCGCTPDCSGLPGALRMCGDDGCGGSCGECGPGTSCDGDGLCCEPDCTFDGVMKMCGDDGCGGSCGECAMGLGCGGELGLCVCEGIAPIYNQLELAGQLHLAQTIVGPLIGVGGEAVLRINNMPIETITSGAMFELVGQLSCEVVGPPATCTNATATVDTTDVLLTGSAGCEPWFGELLRNGLELSCRPGGSRVTAFDECEDETVRIFPIEISIQLMCGMPVMAPAPTCMP